MIALSSRSHVILLSVLVWCQTQSLQADAFRLTPSQDVCIGNDQTLGPYTTYNSSGLHIRDIPSRRRVSFLAFDLPEGWGDQPAISQVQFSLYGHDSGRVDVYGVLEGHDDVDVDKLTWNTAPGVQNAPTPPIDSGVELDLADLTGPLLSFSAPGRDVRAMTLPSPDLDAFLNNDRDGTVLFLLVPAAAGQSAIIRSSENPGRAPFLEGILGMAPEIDPSWTAMAPSVNDQGKTVTLANGLVTGTLSKDSGRMLAMHLGNSPNLIGESWYWSLHSQGEYQTLGDTDYRLLRQEPNLVEVAFRQQGLAHGQLDFDVHYVLRRGDSGFYAFAVLTRESGPAWELEQARSVVRNNPDLFFHLVADEARQVVPPSPWALAEARAAGGILSPSEATRLPDGSVDDKYLFSDFMGEHEVHGWAGHGYGLWSLTPSHEYQNGGPTTQELTVHQTETTPVILNTFLAAHYGSGMLRLDEDEYWQKLYGPFFIYANRGVTPADQWADAKARMALEKEDWPYAWMDHPLFPLERGRVRGRLQLSDGTSPADAWVILSAPEAPPRIPHWQQQCRGYQFYSRADANGLFEIEGVRAGDYSLYAFVEGVPEEFRLDWVGVTQGATTELGSLEWTPLRHGRRLWQIGTFDRSAGEYKYGERFHDGVSWGMYLNYPVDFPHDINFTIDSSREGDDWNYTQMAVNRGDGTYRLPVWNVHFEVDRVVPGQVMLTVGIAASRNGALDVRVNGFVVERDANIWAGAACVRNSIQGTYQLKHIPFSTALLRRGANTISFTQFRARKFANIMYDAIRLEVPSR